MSEKAKSRVRKVVDVATRLTACILDRGDECHNLVFADALGLDDLCALNSKDALADVEADA